MSLPATWFVLPHVGTTGNQGSHPAACADPQGRGPFRRRQLEYRPVRTHDVRDLQRRDLSALPEATAAPTNTRTAHDSHTRQCSLPSRDTPCPVPTPARPTPASPVPATVRSATCADRARMETDTAPRDPQPHFATLPDVLKAVNACFDRWRRPNNVWRRPCCIT